MLLNKRLWAVLLAGLLVIGLLVGFGDGDEAVAKEPRATIGKTMIPAAAFTPSNDDWDYSNGGYQLRSFSGSGNYMAPLWFPVPEVYIRKIILVALDNTGDFNQICLTLYRAQPLKANEISAGHVCTSDSPDDPQRVASTAINPRQINTVNQGPYLWASVDPSTKLYGVQVTYSY